MSHDPGINYNSSTGADAGGGRGDRSPEIKEEPLSFERQGGCQGRVYFCTHSVQGYIIERHLLLRCLQHEPGHSKCHLQGTVDKVGLGGGDLFQCSLWERQFSPYVGDEAVRAHLEVF